MSLSRTGKPICSCLGSVLVNHLCLTPVVGTVQSDGVKVCINCFLLTVIKYPTRSCFEEEGFVLAYCLKGIICHGRECTVGGAGGWPTSLLLRN